MNILDEKALSSIEQVARGDIGFIESLIEKFYLHSEKHRSRLFDALNDRNSLQLHSASHGLKGSALAIGAIAVLEVLDEINERGDHAIFLDADDYARRFEAVLQKTRSAFDLYLKVIKDGI